MRICKPTYIFLAVLAIALLAFDIFAATTDLATISQALALLAGRCSTLPLIFGLLMAHFFWPSNIVLFRSFRNIGLVIFLGWFCWDLFNGIVGNMSVAGSGSPAFAMFLIGLAVGKLLWPQEGK